jgi:hypothetical protein
MRSVTTDLIPTDSKMHHGIVRKGIRLFTTRMRQ